MNSFDVRKVSALSGNEMRMEFISRAPSWGVKMSSERTCGGLTMSIQPIAY